MKRDEILKAFNFRYACKKFDANKHISDEDFNTILESARLSPSSFGFEPWRFLVVQDKALRAKLAPLAWGAGMMPSASHFVIILARKKADMIASSAYITHLMQDVQKLPPQIQEAKRSFYKQFQEKDFALLESDRKIFDWAGKQCYIALANMMSVAALLGIDSCAIEGFDEKAVDAFLVKEKLIDEKHFGVCVMVAFGYRGDDSHARHAKTRQDLKDIVEWL